METTNPYAPPVAELEAHADPEVLRAPFFAVSPLKLVVMNLATLGLYFLYWHYRQWKTIRDVHQEKIWPIPRALFAPLTGFELYPRIHQAATDRGISMGWASWMPAVMAIILNVTEWVLRWNSTAASPYRFIWVLAILPPLMAQMTLQELHAEVAPEADRNARFTAWNIVGLIFGALFWALLLISRWAPDPSFSK